MPLVDSYQREINYLRVSVTDRCNLRCVYCMPEEGAPTAPRSELLTNEELHRLIKTAVELGISKVRFTGGEPLLRPNLIPLIQSVNALQGIQDLSITTNGIRLQQMAADLAEAGIARVNLSLDTLQQAKFERIARRTGLQQVLDGLEAALQHNMTPLKLNCVVMRGCNEDELADFARLTIHRPLHVRFIELMPINWSSGDDSLAQNRFNSLSGAPTGSVSSISLYADAESTSFRKYFQLPDASGQTGMLNSAEMRKAFVPVQEMEQILCRQLGTLEPAELLTNGPAQTFRLPGAAGTIGFISQVTRDMCKNCNRLRLTADGFLRPCLMADGEVNLREAVRSGADDEQLKELWRIAVRHKPLEHRLEDGFAPQGRGMSRLGG